MHDSNLQLRRGSWRLRRVAGFSMVDTLVAMTLSLATIATILTFNRFQMFALRTQSKQVDVQGSTRTLLDLIVGEIRRSGTDPKCTHGFEGIVSAKANQLQLRADLNGNGAIDNPGEDVLYIYYPDSDSLTRTTGGNAETLAWGVLTSFTFRYFNSAGVELVPGSGGLDSTQRSAVRRVRVTMTMQDSSGDPTNNVPVSATFSSVVDIRNRFLVTTLNCS